MPRQRALAHAADGHHVEDRLVALGDPLRQFVQFRLPSDQATGLQQRVRMRNIRLRRSRDVAHIMKRRRIRLAQPRQSINHVAPQSVHRFEEPYNLAGLHALLERLQLLRACAGLHVPGTDQVVFVYHEHQARNTPLARAIVFHLGDRNIVALRHVPIAVRENAEIDLRLIHHAHRFRDGVIVAGRQMLHHHGKEALAHARFLDRLAMLRQVPRRATNHD
jgi:hypothetical protein